jgi:hypothetical protein
VTIPRQANQIGAIPLLEPRDARELPAKLVPMSSRQALAGTLLVFF